MLTQAVIAPIRCALMLAPLFWALQCGTVYAAEPTGASPIMLSSDVVSLSIDRHLPSAREDTPHPPQHWLQQPFDQSLYADSIRPNANAYWHRIQFQGRFSDEQPHRFHLVLNNHILPYLTFYLFDGSRLIKSLPAGLRNSQHDSSYSGIHLNFDIQHNQVLTLLIRKQSPGPAIMPLSIFSEAGFARQQKRQYLFWGAVLAVLLALALYNALIYAMHPGSAYLWYLTFHCTTFLYFSGLHGYGFLIWPDAMQTYLAQHIMTLNFVLLWLVLRFANVFLDARHNTPWHFRYLNAFTWLCLPAAVVSLWLPDYILIPYFSALQAAGSVFGISMALVALRNGFRPARYFLLSWIFTMIGAAVGMATFTAILPANVVTLHGFLLGSLCELMLLSVALADRIKFTENTALAKAYIDPQTNSLNFSFFTNKFPEQLEELQQRHPSLSLLLIDLRGFRELMGLLGPDVYKLAYQRHAERTIGLLKQRPWAVPIKNLLLKDSYYMTLPSGQGLMLVDPGDANPDSVRPIIEELLALSEQALEVNGFSSKIGFLIGCAPFKPHQHSIFECFRQAQVALLSAQRTGLSMEIYSQQQDNFIKQQLSMLSELRQAIAGQQLTIYIQPQYRMQDQRVIGGEVLVRWIHPQQGFISPAVFIPLAEQSQLIFDITRQVLEQACAWLQAQSQAQPPNLPADFHLSVNLSAVDINDNRLLPLVEYCMHEYQINPGQLLFEVTESAVMDDPERFLLVIQQLHKMGFKVAIDDFGTGYSSMAYLQQMNADEIKIDMAFVRNIHQSPTNQNIVKAIVQLARASNAYTVAEGIESDQELQMLKTLDCDVAQGFFWSAPVPAGEFVERFSTTRPAH
jgi:EAL domain-containing protein (putative c-di-GMP-specific phosphodiesterase class I)/GGDEF domain-containing protein